jgi:transmembrane sensor
MNKQAREWFVLMQSGSVSDAQRQQFKDWLEEDVLHQETYRGYEQVWQGLGELAISSDGSALKRSVAGTTFDGFFSHLVRGMFEGGLKPSLAAGFVIVLLSAGIWLMPTTDPDRELVHYETGFGEMRTVSLSDGSTVTIGAKSAIEVSLEKAERNVILVSGQAFFDVAADTSRPFRVKAGRALVRVVGTEFDVYKGEDEVRVSVAEGVVKVSEEAANAKFTTETMELTAGQRATRAADGELEMLGNVPVNSIGGWRSGRLVYQRARLAVVVSDANRYFPDSIELDPAVADLELTAAFDIEQLESLPEILESILPIDVERRSGNRIFIVPERPKTR